MKKAILIGVLLAFPLVWFAQDAVTHASLKDEESIPPPDKMAPLEKGKGDRHLLIDIDYMQV